MLAAIEIHRLHNDDSRSFEELIHLFEEVFGDDRGEAVSSQLNNLLSRSGFFVLIASHHQRIIGGLTAYELERYHSRRSELFVYDIAVREEYRGKGIGRALIGDLIKQCMDTRVESLFVLAEHEDREAVKFYDRVFGAGKGVQAYSLDLKDWKTTNDED